MYPKIGADIPQPSAPPAPTSTTAASAAFTSTTSTLSNTKSGNPLGFSSLMAQPSNQNTPYPTGSPSQPPYPTGPPSQPPYPTGSSFQPPYNNPHSSSNQPANAAGYSSYSLPNVAQQTPLPPQLGSGGYQQSAYPQQPYPYQAQHPASGYPLGQQPPRPTGNQPSYPSSAPYQPQQGNSGNPSQPGNPHATQQGNSGYQNPYQPTGSYPPQQGGYPPQQSYQSPYGSNSQQPAFNSPYGSNAPPPQSYPNPYGSNAPQQPFPGSYGSNPQQPPGGYGGYPPYSQPQQSYQNPYSYPSQQQAGGYNQNSFGSPPTNDRIRSVAARYEINDALTQRLSMLSQFEIVILCDDSGSMNTPVDGTTGTRWDELRSIVQIVMEIGTVFDSNGVDVYFLNRPPMRNVTDSRQVVESFSQKPGGLTPLTGALRQIFQSAAAKSGSDKRLLVFVATDGAPTDPNGNVDIQSLENLMRNERRANTTYVTFLACTDDEESVAYLSQWDRTMMNVDVVDDYKTEREEIRRNRGQNFPFSFGDYVAKALLGAIDPQMDLLDESGGNNNNNNYRRY